MRLILNKALDTVNESVNIKIIEITSTDFLNNDLDYFVYKYQIPLIKFTDTQEIFNIKNFKNELNTSLSEMELILTEDDLELLSGGSGGGSQDLQSVLDEGNTTDNEFYNLYDLDLGAGVATIKTGVINSIGGFNKINGIELQTLGITNQVGFEIDKGGYIRSYASGARSNNHNLGFYLQFSKPNPSYPNIDIYTLATLDDIKKIDLSDRIYANNAAAITGGLTTNDVYRTSTGELRIVI